jgi:hypothetical protein
MSHRGRKNSNVNGSNISILTLRKLMVKDSYENKNLARNNFYSIKIYFKSRRVFLVYPALMMTKLVQAKA